MPRLSVGTTFVPWDGSGIRVLVGSNFWHSQSDPALDEMADEDRVSSEVHLSRLAAGSHAGTADQTLAANGDDALDRGTCVVHVRFLASAAPSSSSSSSSGERDADGDCRVKRRRRRHAATECLPGVELRCCRASALDAVGLQVCICGCNPESPFSELLMCSQLSVSL